jgi:WD40 repeat protein
MEKMMKRKYLGVVVALLLLSGVSWAWSDAERDTQVAQRGRAGNGLTKSEASKVAAFATDIADCSRDMDQIARKAPALRNVFDLDRPILLVKSSEREYTNAIWSPKGDAILFVVPVGLHPLESSDSSTEALAPLGISRNELWLLRLDKRSWKKITDDGMRPRFSDNGQHLFYMSGTGLAKFNFATGKEERTSALAKASATDLLHATPLADGSVVAMSDMNGKISHKGTALPRWNPFELGLEDDLRPSPNEDYIAVNYGSGQIGGVFQDAVTVVIGPNDEIIPVLKSCASSARELAWSPNGDSIAYPVRGEYPSIENFDLSSRSRRVILQKTGGDLSGLSFSPDGKYLVFAQGYLGEAGNAIWIASSDGKVMQRIAERGILPRWSPDGQAVVFAVRGSSGNLDWYLIQLRMH